MTIRISRKIDSGTIVLHVAGQLMSQDIAVLSKELQDIVGPRALELSELKSSDPGGVAMLREIASLGAELRGASPYIELLLKQES